MCLGIPMRVKAVDQFVAQCEAKGVEREVSLLMLQGEELVPGDFIVVSTGYATQKITAEEAEAAWDIYDQMLAAEDLLAGNAAEMQQLPTSASSPAQPSSTQLPMHPPVLCGGRIHRRDDAQQLLLVHASPHAVRVQAHATLLVLLTRGSG